MAIHFYDSIDLNRQELLNARIQNLASDPATGSEVVGQIIFNTADDTLKQYVADTQSPPVPGSPTPGWIAVGSVPGNGTLTVQGTAPLGGTGTFTANQTGNTTISVTHAAQGQNNSTPSSTLTSGGTFTALSANVGVNATGHVTGQALTTYTLPTSVTSVDTTDGTYISLTPTSATSGVVTVTAELSAVDGTAAETTVGNGIRYLSKNNKWAEIDTIPGTYDWIIKSTGPAAGTTFNTTIASGQTLEVIGKESVIATLSASGSLSLDVDLNYGGVTGYGANYVMIPGTSAVSSDDTIPFNLYTPGSNPPTTATDIVKKSTFGTIPIEALTLVKTYIDNSLVGGLIYQGGYNAATNSPNLDASPSPNLIKKGWTYTVTVEGLFFTEQVRAGDVLIAEVNAPTGINDWTTVQNNIDLASLTTIGIGNVIPSTLTQLLGIDVAYSSGTASLGLDVNGLTELTNSGADLIANNDELIIFDESASATGTNKKIKVENLLAATSGITTFAANVTSITAGTPKSVTHSLGSTDVMVQLFDNATKETIYATVDRTGINTVALTFNATAPTTVRILVQKIG
jgi:hypothetical protein